MDLLSIIDKDPGAHKMVEVLAFLVRDRELKEEACLEKVSEEDCMERDQGEVTGDSLQAVEHLGLLQIANLSRRVTTLGPLSTMARRQHQHQVQDLGIDSQDNNRET